MSTTPTYPEEPTLDTTKGNTLHYKTWPAPTSTPKGIIFLIHGMGEHIERDGYEHIGQRLSDEGYYVFGHDHIGHGRSSGKRMQVGSFNDYAEDLVDHVKYQVYDEENERKEEFKELPLFLFGHSMGGLVSVITLIMYPKMFDGAVLSAPALIVNSDLVEKAGLVKFVGKVMPKSKVPGSEVESSKISRNPQAVEDYDNDPYNNHKLLKANFLVQFLKGMNFAIDRVEEIDKPLFLFHSNHDELVKVEASKLIMEKTKSENNRFL